METVFVVIWNRDSLLDAFLAPVLWYQPILILAVSHLNREPWTPVAIYLYVLWKIIL